MFMYLHFSTPTTSEGQDGLLQFVCGLHTSLGWKSGQCRCLLLVSGF